MESRKKILYWSYLGHKHLGSPLNVTMLAKKGFQEEINSSDTEIKLIGANHILDNLVIHGFAVKENGGILLNQEGISAASLVANTYYAVKDEFFDNLDIVKLIPRNHQVIGYYAMYISAWLLILESISLLMLTVLTASGLIDEVKNFLPKNLLAIPLIFLAFSPLTFLVFSFVAYIKPKKN